MCGCMGGYACVCVLCTCGCEGGYACVCYVRVGVRVDMHVWVGMLCTCGCEGGYVRVGSMHMCGWVGACVCEFVFRTVVLLCASGADVVSSGQKL